MEPTALLAQATAVLGHNDTGVFIKPGPGQYPHQWNWDAAFIAIGLAHYDRPRAEAEIRALLQGQWRDGMVPHIVCHGGPADYFPDPEFWQIETSAQAPPLPTSGITQPPVLATAVRLMHERATDYDASLAFVRQIYPALLAWHRWLYAARDPHNTGLVAIIHPWESGTDNATRWAEPMRRVKPSNLPAYRRRDRQHVVGGERPTDADYECYIYLIDHFRRAAYDTSTLYETSPFLVQDLLFNALLHRANEDLRTLALELGESSHEIDAWLQRTHDAFANHLWHEEAGLYFDYDLRIGAPIRDNNCATFIPLFAGLCSEAVARRLLQEHLLNPEEYAPDEQTRYYLPSASKNNPLWEPRRYWRGPVWVIINWMVLHGLRRYGYDELAAQIRRHTLELVSEQGFYEYYDPRDGTGAGSPQFSWSAALTIDLLSEEVDVSAA
jgi:hypothetical protein